MIIKTLEQIRDTERDVQDETWYSRRLLLEKDGMGFSMHDTVMRAGTETIMWYKYHQEAVYCVDGEGEIEDLTSGKIHQVKPGTLYALDGHERHCVRPKTDLRLICVFNPPCTGRETHGADGAYPLLSKSSK